MQQKLASGVSAASFPRIQRFARSAFRRNYAVASLGRYKCTAGGPLRYDIRHQFGIIIPAICRAWASAAGTRFSAPSPTAWQLSGIATFATGTPLTLNANFGAPNGTRDP